MKKLKSNDRRSFIQKGLKKGALFLTGTVPLVCEPTEKIKMMMPDGKIVEVSKSHVMNKGGKTKNKDIIQWMDNPSTKSSNKK